MIEVSIPFCISQGSLETQNQQNVHVCMWMDRWMDGLVDSQIDR